MGKALKVFIILNLLMSVGVIALGIQTFSARKLLKAETLELEKTLHQVSNDLKWGAKVPWENEGEEKELAFDFSQPTTAAGLSNLKSELEPLGRFSTQRQAQLSQRYTELKDTRERLANKKNELSERERDLAAAEKQETQLTADLNKTNAELATVNSEVTTLENSKSAREQDLSSKNTNLTTLNNELASLEIDLDSRIQERDNAQAEYERCKTGSAGKEKRSQNARGKKGLVLAVNNDWEYVVIDKGDTEIEPDFEAYVHRGKDFVGKLNILRVEEDLAIAEIVTDSIAEGDRIQPGDTLFF